MATLKDITMLLKSIENNTSLLVQEEKQIIEQTEILVKQNEKQKLLLNSEQPKPDIPKKPKLKPYISLPSSSSEIEQLLSKIEQMVNHMIERNRALCIYHEKLLNIYYLLDDLVPKVSIKEYITGCDIESIKNCYDYIDEQLQLILLLPSKQQEQVTIFHHGYLLYDLVRDNEIDHFRYLLTSDGITYNDVIHKPRLQVGGKPLKLLQVIGLTKIKAILEYMYEKYKEATEYNFSITKGATTVKLEEYLSTKSYASKGVNIFYERNDEQESVQQIEELTAEHCKQIYKNGNIINIIASFFYEEAILHKKQ